MSLFTIASETVSLTGCIEPIYRAVELRRVFLEVTFLFPFLSPILALSKPCGVLFVSC